jgi:hypothetical protein
MLRTFLASLLIYATTLTAFAQTTDPPAQTSTPGAPQHSVSDWLEANRYPGYGHRLAIVTLAKPGVRQSCEVQEITQDAIICRAKHHHKQTTYQRDEIASIIDPPDHASLVGPSFLLVVGAAVLAGLFLDPYLFGVVLSLPIGITLYVLARHEDKRSHRYRKNDIILYRAPEAP